MATKKQVARQEAVKTTARMTVLGAVALVVTYVVRRYWPDTPQDVTAAVVFLLGVAWDNYQHKTGGKVKVPF